VCYIGVMPKPRTARVNRIRDAVLAGLINHGPMTDHEIWSSVVLPAGTTLADVAAARGELVLLGLAVLASRPAAAGSVWAAL